MKKHWIQALVAVAILLAGGAVGYLLLHHGGASNQKQGAGDDGKKGPPPPPPGQVKLQGDAIKKAGIGLETSGPAVIHTTIQLYGKVAANDDVLVNVSPRFAGIVRKVNAGLGDKVTADQVLVTVESNESLRPYDIRAGLNGTVINKNVAPGEYVSPSDTLYVVNDLTSVFVDLNVYRQDYGELKVGQAVLIDLGDGNPPVENKLDYLSPFGASDTQSLLARVVVLNPRGELRPGLFLSAVVTTHAETAPVTVRVAALQTVDGKPSVFVRLAHDTFQAKPVTPGRQDGDYLEITGGLEAGETYAAVNSFVLKAELGKSTLGGE